MIAENGSRSWVTQQEHELQVNLLDQPKSSQQFQHRQHVPKTLLPARSEPAKSRGTSKSRRGVDVAHGPHREQRRSRSRGKISAENYYTFNIASDLHSAKGQVSGDGAAHMDFDASEGQVETERAMRGSVECLREQDNNRVNNRDGKKSILKLRTERGRFQQAELTSGHQSGAYANSGDSCSGDNQLYIWGVNCAALGIGSNFPLAPQAINIGIKVSLVACGLDFVVMASTQQQVYAFGDSEWMQNGGKGHINQIRFQDEGSGCENEIERIEDIDCGDQYCLVLCRTYRGGNQSSDSLNRQSLFAWGRNDRGQLGIGSDEKAVARPRRVPIDGDQTIRSIRCGSNHSALLVSSGEVLMFGSNRQGQLGVQTQPQTWIRTPAPLGLLAKGIPLTDVALGQEHSLVLSSDHRIFSFGQNAEGQLGLGKNCKTLSTSSPSVIAELSVHKILRVKAGGNTSAAFSDKGHLFVWGQGIWGSFFDANRVRGFSRSTETDTQIDDFGLGRDGMVWVKDVARRVHVWGPNNSGQLGIGTKQNRKKPTLLPDISSPQQIVNGNGFTIALCGQLLDQSSQVVVLRAQNSGTLLSVDKIVRGQQEVEPHSGLDSSQQSAQSCSQLSGVTSSSRQKSSQATRKPKNSKLTAPGSKTRGEHSRKGDHVLLKKNLAQQNKVSCQNFPSHRQQYSNLEDGIRQLAARAGNRQTANGSRDEAAAVATMLKERRATQVSQNTQFSVATAPQRLNHDEVSNRLSYEQPSRDPTTAKLNEEVVESYVRGSNGEILVYQSGSGQEYRQDGLCNDDPANDYRQEAHDHLRSGSELVDHAADTINCHLLIQDEKHDNHRAFHRTEKAFQSKTTQNDDYQASSSLMTNKMKHHVLAESGTYDENAEARSEFAGPKRSHDAVHVRSDAGNREQFSDPRRASNGPAVLERQPDQPTSDGQFSVFKWNSKGHVVSNQDNKRQSLPVSDPGTSHFKNEQPQANCIEFTESTERQNLEMQNCQRGDQQLHLGPESAEDDLRAPSNEVPHSPETFHRQETFVQQVESEQENQLKTWESKADSKAHDEQLYRAEWARYSSRMTSKATLHPVDPSSSRRQQNTENITAADQNHTRPGSIMGIERRTQAREGNHVMSDIHNAVENGFSQHPPAGAEPSCKLSEIQEQFNASAGRSFDHLAAELAAATSGSFHGLKDSQVSPIQKKTSSFRKGPLLDSYANPFQRQTAHSLERNAYSGGRGACVASVADERRANDRAQIAMYRLQKKQQIDYNTHEVVDLATRKRRECKPTNLNRSYEQYASAPRPGYAASQTRDPGLEVGAFDFRNKSHLVNERQSEATQNAVRDSRQSQQNKDHLPRRLIVDREQPVNDRHPAIIHSFQTIGEKPRGHDNHQYTPAHLEHPNSNGYLIERSLERIQQKFSSQKGSLTREKPERGSSFVDPQTKGQMYPEADYLKSSTIEQLQMMEKGYDKGVYQRQLEGAYQATSPSRPEQQAHQNQARQSSRLPQIVNQQFHQPETFRKPFGSEMLQSVSNQKISRSLEPESKRYVRFEMEARDRYEQQVISPPCQQRAPVAQQTVSSPTSFLNPNLAHIYQKYDQFQIKARKPMGAPEAAQFAQPASQTKGEKHQTMVGLLLQQRDNLQDQLHIEQNKCGQVQEQLQQMEEKVHALESEKQSTKQLHSSKQASLERELEALRLRLTTAEDRAEIAEKRARDADEVSRAEYRRELEATREEARRQREDARRYKEDLERVRANEQEAREELRRAELEQRRFREEVEGLRRSFEDEATRSKQKHQETIRLQRKEREEQEVERARMERTVEEYRQKLDVVEHETAKMRSDMSVLREQAIERERRHDEYQRQLKDLQGMAEAAALAKRDNARLQEKCQASESTVAGLRKTVQELVAGKGSLAAALDKQTLRTTQLETLLKQSQDERDDRKRELEEQRSRYEEIKELNARLQERLDQKIMAEATRQCQDTELLDLVRQSRRDTAFFNQGTLPSQEKDDPKNDMSAIQSRKLGSESRPQIELESFDAKNAIGGGLRVGAGLVSDRGVSEGTYAAGVAHRLAGNVNDSVITTYQYNSLRPLDQYQNALADLHQRQSQSFSVSRRSIPQRLGPLGDISHAQQQLMNSTNGHQLDQNASKAVRTLDSQSINLSHISVPRETSPRNRQMVQSRFGERGEDNKTADFQRQEVDFDYAAMRRKHQEVSQARDDEGTATQTRRLRTQTYSPIRVVDHFEKEQKILKSIAQNVIGNKQGKSISPVKKDLTSAIGSQQKLSHYQLMDQLRNAIDENERLLGIQPPYHERKNPEQRDKSFYRNLVSTERRASSILSNQGDGSILLKHLPVSPIQNPGMDQNLSLSKKHQLYGESQQTPDEIYK